MMSAESVSRHYLTPLFEPASVAIIGASTRAGAIGTVLIDNMRAAGYRGGLYAVNPRHRRIRGVPCFARVADLPRRVDLAVIATPPHTVPQLIAECGAAGVPAAVVITAGFSETGEAGAALERELLDHARRHGLRLIGPNCLGLMRPSIGLNATFARGAALPGSLGLISQSGALCTAMLDWATPRGIGFSSVVSLGGSRDVDFGEAIDYLVNDAKTEHILLYIEGVRDARRFLSSLRAAARLKPVILMKVGRHPVGSRAAVSHTGALVGADDVFDAAVRRAGAVRVTTIGQLVAAALALSARVRPRGDRLAIVTNGGGPGVMAADRAADLGIPLATLSGETIASLQDALPANWSHGNPLDLIGDADAGRYRAAVKACLGDAAVDGVLVLLTPQAMTDAAAVATAVAAAAKGQSKPVLACWMGGESVSEGRRRLAKAGIPVFQTPEPAVEMFAHVSSFYRNQRALLQTPGPLALHAEPDIEGARRIIDAALAAGRTLLGEAEAKALLAAFRLPVTPTFTARDADEAVAQATATGYPVVLKIDSPDITHKTDAGGVKLNLADAAAVRAAFTEITADAARFMPRARILGVTVQPMVMRRNGRELMVGVIRDPVFGPAIAFGGGGVAVEVHRDRAVALPPLNAFLVDELIRGTRVSKLLGPFRRMPAIDRAALDAVLLRISEMVCELPWIDELDINPLVVDEQGAVIVDARVVVRPYTPTRGRYGHMAIHPYPARLVSRWTTADGVEVTLRPIRPEDAEMEQAFVRGLSPESRRYRFMDTLRELTPAMLVRFTQIDYDREMAFVATIRREGREVEVGVCRYITNPDATSCEYAIVLADDWQGRGLGRRMMAELIAVARRRGLQSMIGVVLSGNRAMLDLCQRLGFAIGDDDNDPQVKQVRLQLQS
jgi:acetyltransferase